MAKNTGKDYREKNRIRLQRHYARQAAAGKKRVSAVIPGETPSQKAEAVQPEMGHTPAGTASIHQDAEPEKAPEVDQGPPTQANVSDPASVSQSTPARQEPEPIAIQDPDPQAGGGTQQPEPVTQASEAYAGIIPDCAGKTLKIDERDELVRKVMEALPGRDNVQNRLDVLNSRSVPVVVKPGKYGGTWTRQKVKDNLKGARDRLKKNQAAVGIRFSEKPSSTK